MLDGVDRRCSDDDTKSESVKFVFSQAKTVVLEEMAV
jgi:hypothetical protein